MALRAQSARAKAEEVLRYGFSSFPRFCGLLDIVPKSGARQKFQLNEIQRAYCGTRTQRDVVLKPRQIGFTTLEQGRDVFKFLTFPGARVVVTCQSMTDHTARDLLWKNYDVMFDSLAQLGLRLDFRSRGKTGWVLADRDASLRIVEAGASQAAAEKKGRAGTITRLHLTETAFYEYAGETLNALEECVPTVSLDSEIVNESTANGASGLFYDSCKLAQIGASGYTLHFYPWFRATEYALPLDDGETIKPETERERELITKHAVKPEQLKWYRRKLAEKRNNQELVDQEYPSDPETCFLASGRMYFDRATVDKLARGICEPIAKYDHDRIWLFKKPVIGSRYIIGGDPSGGVGRNAAAALAYDITTGEHIATIHGQYAPAEFADALYRLARLLNNAVIAPERENHGHAVILRLTTTLKYGARVYIHHDKKYGWSTTPVTRPLMLDKLDESMRSGVWKTKDARVISELRTFVRSDTGKPEASAGAQDDLVLAGAIGWGALTLGNRAIRDLPDHLHA
jgi:hypothetical protein